MVRLPDRQSHDGQGRIGCRAAGENATIGYEQVGNVMALSPTIGHTIRRIGTHAGNAHIVTAAASVEVTRLPPTADWNHSCVTQTQVNCPHKSACTDID